MSNVNHILSRLSTMRKVESKIKSNKVQLGKVDDLVDKLRILFGEVDGLSINISELVGTALSDAQELSNMQNQVEELYQEAMQTVVDIEDIGLEVPSELTDATEEAKGIIDASVGTLINALNECERVLYTGGN